MDLYNFTNESIACNFNSLSINNFNLSVGSKNLFKDSNLILSSGNKYGFIGKNGYGKTSLLKQIPTVCDETKMRHLYVEQELILDERLPVQFILDSNVKLKLIEERVNMLRMQFENDEGEFNEDSFKELEEAENELNSFNPNKEESIIKKILVGLGFSIENLEKPSNLFSGGWQMRLSLGRALYLEPDLLLLDEPTNHLDLEAIIWLSNYLQSWKKIAVIVSHNIGFLNSVCSHIINIENYQTKVYKGNYYKFKKEYDNKLLEAKNNYESYDRKIKEMKKKNVTKDKIETFIKKNKVERPEKDYDIKIDFLPVRTYSNNIIKIENVSFSYYHDNHANNHNNHNNSDNNENKILDNITLGLSMESRVTLVGLNGSGKSTLIKLIMGEIKPQSGTISVKDGVKIGYYNQHFDQQLPFDKTPIEFLMNIAPSSDLIGKNLNKYEIVRSYLGKIKLDSSNHTKLIGELSGGQKARVALIKLIFEQPQILLLDEPTNHLDIETVETLIESLETFTGGMVLITHEPEMIERLSTNIWMLDKDTKKIITNINSFDDYCNLILSS